MNTNKLKIQVKVMMTLMAVCFTVSCGEKGSQMPPHDSLQKIGETTTYTIDSINGLGREDFTNNPTLVNNQPISVIGWAYDEGIEKPAAGVYVCVDNQCFTAEYGIGRGDVAAALKKQQLDKVGFKVTTPALQLTPGKHNIICKVVTADKKGYRTGKWSTVFTIKQ